MTASFSGWTVRLYKALLPRHKIKALGRWKKRRKAAGVGVAQWCEVRGNMGEEC